MSDQHYAHLLNELIKLSQRLEVMEKKPSMHMTWVDPLTQPPLPPEIQQKILSEIADTCEVVKGNVEVRFRELKDEIEYILQNHFEKR